MRLTLEIPESGRCDTLSVVVEPDSPRGPIRVQSGFSSGVIYLIWWAADLADWSAEDGPGRPEIRIVCPGGRAVIVEWFDQLFQENRGPVTGARELFEATGLIEEPKLLAWVL